MYGLIKVCCLRGLKQRMSINGVTNYHGKMLIKRGHLKIQLLSHEWTMDLSGNVRIIDDWQILQLGTMTNVQAVTS